MEGLNVSEIANIDVAPVSQGTVFFGRESEPWTPAELALLDSLIHRRVSKAELRRLFPGRTVRAAKARLTKRREAHNCKRKPTYSGLGSTSVTILSADDEGLNDDELLVRKRRARHGSERMAAAIRRLCDAQQPAHG